MHLQSAAAHGEIERVGVSDALVSLRLGLDEFDAQRVGQSRDHLILQLEQVGHVLLESIRPEMGARLRVDQLRVDAHPALVALH